MTTESVSKYSIYCNTEGNSVSGWGTTPPTVCYNNNTHSVDTGQVSTIETVINVNAGSTTTVKKYKIYCNTENSFVEGWGESSPSTCYNDSTHSINLNSVQEIDTVNNSQVKIIEDGVKVSRNVKVVHIEFENVEANQSQTKIYTFRYITSMYSYKFATDDTNKGDSITIAIDPNSPMGLITQDITTGDTVISAPLPLVLYGSAGFNVNISDGVNSDDLGEIISIDKVNNTIEVENPAQHDYSAIDTTAYMTYYNMRNMKIGPPQMYAFGEDIIGGASVPVGTNVHFTYTNNATTIDLTDEPKNMSIYMTILF
jgi:hypothetical protein